MIRSLAAALALAAAVGLALPVGGQERQIVSFSGQLLDLRNGYVFFSTGDAFPIVELPRLVDYATGRPTTALQPKPRMWARAILDPALKKVIELDLSRKPIKVETAYTDARPFAVAASMPTTNPELNPEGKTALTGKDVPVAFDVVVPPTTPLNADVYISTDASGWDARAIKADRVDGQHYRVTRRFASGTKFAFRITRGSWQTEEVGQNGLEQPVHQFTVREVDTQVSHVTVYAWLDQRPNAPQALPGAIPTPFNPNPFPGGIFPPSRATPPGGGTRPVTPP